MRVMMRESRSSGDWRRQPYIVISLFVIVVTTMVNLKGSTLPLLTGRITTTLSIQNTDSVVRNLQTTSDESSSSDASINEATAPIDSSATNYQTPPSGKPKSRIPTILLAGAQKASTSSLAVYLMGHNQTCFSDAEQCDSHSYGKESHFFDSTKYEVGLKYYEYLYRKCPQDAILIEGTPNTMAFPDRVKQIYDEHGSTHQLKIIFVLREPVSREISWYDHQVRISKQSANRPWWTKDVYDDKGNIRSFIQTQRATVIPYFDNDKYDSLYGYYAYWLHQWSQYFDRKQQILILSYDELVSNPSRLLHRVHEFLNITIQGPLRLPLENSFKKKTPRPPCTDQMELLEYFKSPNEQLYKFLEDNPGPSMEQRPFPEFQLQCQQQQQQSEKATTTAAKLTARAAPKQNVKSK